MYRLTLVAGWNLAEAEEYAKLVMHMVDNPIMNGEVVRLDSAIRLAPR